MQLKRERRLVKIFVRRNVQYIADPPRWRPQPDCARCCMPATCCAPIALSASDFSDANWDVPVRDRVDRVDLRRGHGRPPERFSAPWTGTFVLLGTVRARSRP